MTEAPLRKRSRKTYGHKRCPRCGNKSYNVNKKQCAKCGYGRSSKRND